MDECCVALRKAQNEFGVECWLKKAWKLYCLIPSEFNKGLIFFCLQHLISVASAKKDENLPENGGGEWGREGEGKILPNPWRWSLYSLLFNKTHSQTQLCNMHLNHWKFLIEKGRAWDHYFQTLFLFHNVLNNRFDYCISLEWLQND